MVLKRFRVRYRSNNSGGSWWLKDEDWRKLEAAGWGVEWYPDTKRYPGGRFLGALATYASLTVEARGVDSAKQRAKLAWEEALGMDAYSPGCACCGPPHNFYAEEVPCESQSSA